MKIWVLGSEHRNADDCINWGDEFPYFPNCDVLIINTTTLSSKLNTLINSKLINNAQKSIFDMLMVSDKKVIVIMGGPFNWLPLYPVLTRIPSANIIEYDVENYLRSYYENVNMIEYTINSYNASYMFGSSKSMSKETYNFVDDISKYGFSKRNIVRSEGNHTIGSSITFKLYRTVAYLMGPQDEHLYDSGEITFLPPPTKISSEKGIDIILGDLIGIDIKEMPPEWLNNILMPKQEEMERYILETKKIIEEKEGEVLDLMDARSELEKYRRLLWTKGTPLENIVEDAFRYLGFDDIRKERSDDLEDGIFDFQTSEEYEHGVLEVKGSDSRTSLANLTQCNKWVEDYLIDDINVKGVFIPNQFRLEEYPDSMADKRHFEPNEIEYARTRHICILPTFEIFNTVCEKMKGNPEVTREKLEEKILSANGICNLI